MKSKTRIQGGLTPSLFFFVCKISRKMDKKTSQAKP